MEGYTKEKKQLEKLHKLVMKRHSDMGANDKMTFELWSAFMIRMHQQQQRLSIVHTLCARDNSVNFRQTASDSRVDSSTLTEETGSQNLANQTNREACTRKRPEARVRRHDQPTVPSTSSKRWVRIQVVDQSRHL